jgi:hypothetical protein
MLTHVVCFKYKDTAVESDRDEHRARLRGLENLDGVLDVMMGADVVRSARSYDTGLIVTFRDRAALDAYQVDTTHVGVAQFGLSLCDHIVTVDFDTAS